MTTCPNCEADLADDADFCPDCGRSIAEAQGARNKASAPSNLIGRTIFGEYRIVEQLGVGGMGAVYLAEQEAIDQKIAVKVLHPDSTDREETVKRFHREAKVISMLSHPNIVRVLVFGRTDDDLLLLAMEYVEGEELRERVGLSPMDEAEAIKIMKQACSAASEAHDLGIIHRDLKPENILLTDFRGEDNFVKILDFGIAKIKYSGDGDETKLTEAGTVHGTPEFISPEQAQALELDGRSDIYALGCMLYEMITGRLPFESERGVEILEQKVHQHPPAPSEFMSVAPTMEDTIMNAIARDPEDRYDDALEMYDDLVLRERELISQDNTDPEMTYVPGSELTGLHRPIDASSDDRTNPEPSVDSNPGASEVDARPNPSTNTDSGGPNPVLISIVVVLGVGVVGLAILFGYLLAA